MNKTFPHENFLPFKRLILIHSNLRLESVGEGLTESLSDEEIAEHILFFCDTEQNASSRRSPEALRFFSLCVALYTLPSSLGAEETTRYVHLDGSTLVFSQLEDREDVFAAALCKDSIDPDVINQSLQKSHSLFQLLRGGGIRHRLRNGNNRRGKDSMSEVFQIRAAIRKLRECIKVGDLDREAGQREIVEKEKVLSTLVETLPVQQLRKELSIHYRTYIEHAQDLYERCPSSFESLLVSSLKPNLSYYQDLRHRGQAPLVQLRDKARETLRNLGAKSMCSVSLFDDGNLAWTETSARSAIASESLVEIFDYMMSFEVEKMIQLKKRTSDATDGNRSRKPLPAPLRELDQTAKQSSKVIENGFLVSPPLSMLSSLDTESTLTVDSTEDPCWAPTVFISSSEVEQGLSKFRAAILRRFSISFLVMLGCDDSEEQDRIHSKIISTIRLSLFAEFHQEEDSDWEHISVVDTPLLDKDLLFLGHFRNKSLLLSRSFVRANGKNSGQVKAGPRMAGLDEPQWFSSNLPTGTLQALNECTSMGAQVEQIRLIKDQWIHSVSDGPEEAYLAIDALKYRTVTQISRIGAKAFSTHSEEK